jgi:hypothetical protein
VGIDIYMEWRKQTKKEKDAQVTGFSITDGHNGYLREAYHGGPYVTQYLLQEAFNSKHGKAQIPAATLRERLPAAVMMAIYREHLVYGEGKNPGVIRVEDGPPGQLLTMVKTAIQSRDPDMTEELEIANSFNEEQVRAASHIIETRRLPDFALAFVDFVRLAEKKEAETGEPVTIIASY